MAGSISILDANLLWVFNLLGWSTFGLRFLSCEIDHRGVSSFLKGGGGQVVIQVVMRRGAAAGCVFYSAKKWWGNCPPCPPFTDASEEVLWPKELR